MDQVLRMLPNHPEAPGPLPGTHVRRFRNAWNFSCKESDHDRHVHTSDTHKHTHTPHAHTRKADIVLQRNNKPHQSDVCNIGTLGGQVASGLLPPVSVLPGRKGDSVAPTLPCQAFLLKPGSAQVINCALRRCWQCWGHRQGHHAQLPYLLLLVLLLFLTVLGWIWGIDTPGGAQPLSRIPRLFICLRCTCFMSVCLCVF